jgi:sugar transferase (PEP-CTERM/EpsH1 system associated)
MANILFLAHRIPYPPNKGDKIRSWHVLEHLLKSHNVHLGFFVDDELDLVHVPFLEEKTVSSCWELVSKPGQFIRSLMGLFTSKPLSVEAYPKAILKSYVECLCRQKQIDLVYVFSGAMMEFTDSPVKHNIPVIVDLVDVDSAKWADYAASSVFPLSAIFDREAKVLLRYEEDAAQKSKSTLFVSEAEAALFNKLTNDRIHTRVKSLNNGVDLKKFDPEKYEGLEVGGHNGSARAERPVVLFTGAMDYRPNVEAVSWFADAIWPVIKEKQPDAIFRIAGGPVAASVQKLNGQNDIEVVGYVDDMAEEISKASVIVAPLKTARGIQNKVLEGMAMAKPVVATGLANEGINAKSGDDIIVANDIDGFALAVINLLENIDTAKALGVRARTFVENHFVWEQAFSVLDQTFETVLSE